MAGEHGHAMDGEPQSFVAEPASSLPELRWKVGFEHPPFLSTNSSVVQLLISIADGTIDAIPSVAVSDAVAVQIYRLIFDKFASAKELKQAKIQARGLYIILASLVLGTRTEPPDPKDVRRLERCLGRAAGGGQEPGLAVRFTDIINQRRKHAELRELSLEDARQRLYIRWDSVPFGFDFGQPQTAATAAGGGDGGGAARAWRRWQRRRWRCG